MSIKTRLAVSVIWLSVHSALLSTSHAQALDTLLIQIRRPATQDAPAYISSVGRQMAVAGDTVYVADGYFGVEVYKLADREDPRLLGTYPTGEYTDSIWVDREQAYASDSRNGIVVFDIRDPSKLQQLGRSDVSPEAIARAFQANAGSRSGSTDGVAAIVEHRIYIARNDLGVAVIELRSWQRPRRAPLRNGVFNFYPPIKVSTLVSRPEIVHGGPIFPRPQETVVRIDDEVTPDNGALATVEHLTVLRESRAALELAAAMDAGTLRLSVLGPPGATVRVQRRYALAGDWEKWQTITLGDSPFELRDEDAAGADQIFYRAVIP